MMAQLEWALLMSSWLMIKHKLLTVMMSPHWTQAQCHHCSGLSWRSPQFLTLASHIRFQRLFFCVSAWEDRPQCFQTRLWCPLWCVELGNHPGKTALTRNLTFCFVWARVNEQSSPWESLLCVCSTSWPREGFPTPSGIVFLISWHKWSKVNLHSSATPKRGSSPPSSSTLLTYGKHQFSPAQNYWLLKFSLRHLNSWSTFSGASLVDGVRLVVFTWQWSENESIHWWRPWKTVWS